MPAANTPTISGLSNRASTNVCTNVTPCTISRPAAAIAAPRRSFPLRVPTGTVSGAGTDPESSRSGARPGVDEPTAPPSFTADSRIRYADRSCVREQRSPVA